MDTTTIAGIFNCSAGSHLALQKKRPVVEASTDFRVITPIQFLSDSQRTNVERLGFLIPALECDRKGNTGIHVVTPYVLKTNSQQPRRVVSVPNARRPGPIDFVYKLDCSKAEKELPHSQEERHGSSDQGNSTLIVEKRALDNPVRLLRDWATSVCSRPRPRRNNLDNDHEELVQVGPHQHRKIVGDQMKTIEMITSGFSGRRPCFPTCNLSTLVEFTSI